MKTYAVEGGKPLCGSIDVHGSKNAALPILAATVINGGKSVIHNCPDLSDVESIIEILKILGCRVYRHLSDVFVDSGNFCYGEIPRIEMMRTRSSSLFAGALLARGKKAYIPGIGGCVIGKRPIDIHLKAFSDLGVNIFNTSSGVRCDGFKAHSGYVNLDFPSVGATENIMLFASGIPGLTVIKNAAKEPEVQNLAQYLLSIGVFVEGAGTDCIKIKGTTCPTDGEVTVIPDRIVASTYMCAALSSGGSLEVCGVNPDHIASVISILREMGARVECCKDTVSVTKVKRCTNPDRVCTDIYPGFPTDCQPILVSLMSISHGRGTVREQIFENRISHCRELNKMGADISVSGRNMNICGVDALKGSRVYATDLRCGASLVTAALGAVGKSYISGIEYIERGYEDLCRDLSLLGAKIERVE